MVYCTDAPFGHCTGIFDPGSGCGLVATCEAMGCGGLFDALDAQGCLRPACETQADCPQGASCVDSCAVPDGFSCTMNGDSCECNADSSCQSRCIQDMCHDSVLTWNGCKSCDDARSTFSEELGALRAEVSSCTVDADCTCADTVSACSTDCPATIATTQLSYYESQVEALGLRSCGSPSFVATCGVSSGSCPPCEAACVDGQCVNAAVL